MVTPKYWHLHRLKKLRESLSHLDITHDEELCIYQAYKKGSLIYTTYDTKRIDKILSELIAANLANRSI